MGKRSSSTALLTIAASAVHADEICSRYFALSEDLAACFPAVPRNVAKVLDGKAKRAEAWAQPGQAHSGRTHIYSAPACS